MCVKILKNYQLYQHSFFLMMPKYAVAVGRCTGIYDTYDECQLQVKNYPKAKFKKFNTMKEAEDFIAKYSTASSSNCVNSGVHFRVENENRPEMFSLKKSPKKDTGLNDIFAKLSEVEERIMSLTSITTSSLEELKVRVSKIEAICTHRQNQTLLNEDRPRKKMKIENEMKMDCEASKFLKNANDVVEVYTDGACTNNGKSGAMAGIGVWFNHGHPLNVSAPLKGPATNNNAEIQAARVAINQAADAGLKQLCVYTDSKFLISCITSWINKWKKNNWKLVDGGEVKNKIELVKLDCALQRMESVEWIHVRGHVGNEGNEMADRLAREGAARYKTNVTYSDFSDI